MTTNQIIWHQLPNESPDERIDRLNKDLHRIFFESKDVCPERFLEEDGFEEGPYCHLCRMCFGYIEERPYKHSTPRFLEILDAMQLIVESGKFAEVREEYYHWRINEGKLAHECTILLYNRGPGDRIYFKEESSSRQEAFYLTALKAVGYEVVQEKQGESRI